jgi:alpha-tubulin suppressor-like RCC1 family protein
MDPENRYQPEILHSLKFQSKLVKIAGGMHHTLFLDDEGLSFKKLFFFERYKYSTFFFFICQGHVYSVGSHRYGSLGLGKIEADCKTPLQITDLKDIIDIAANTNVSYAIDKFGKVYSWGTNYSKQLGHDDEEDYWEPKQVSSKQVDVRNVYRASVGGQHTLFIMSEEIEE